MRRFFDLTGILSSESGFFEFQNEIVNDVYDTIGRSYSANANEVAIVTELVKTLNGKQYNNHNCQISLSAVKIHGSRSYVEFNYRDKPITKELGDMVVISLVTDGRTRLLQRICIIQTKKGSNQKWEIDRGQLFLLKNFPPFSGNRGIFRGRNNIIFRNRSGCLGAFGLFFEPGEMMFISAPLTEGFLRDKNMLSASEIWFPHLDPQSLDSKGYIGYFGYPILHFDYKIIFDLLHDLPRRGAFLHEFFGFVYSFLGNFRFGRDIYDFIRAWTQINLGELTLWDKSIINQEVDSFANQLIRKAGFGEDFDLPKDDRDNEEKFEGEMAVFLLHINIGKRTRED